MSVYDKVQHTMIPMKSVSQEHLAWIGQIADTCAEFCTAVGFDEPDGVQLVSMALQMAGETLWKQCDGKPCWSQLRVDSYVPWMKQNTCGDRDVLKTMVQALTLFYIWLGDTERIRRDKAVRKARQLTRHCGMGEAAMNAPLFARVNAPMDAQGSAASN
jgi:hypothetical protein